jgi:hypothetical protein
MSCKFEGCKKYASFNFEGEKGSKYCAKHKHTDMINFKVKRCEAENCKIIPTFNFKGEKIGKYCDNIN